LVRAGSSAVLGGGVAVDDAGGFDVGDGVREAVGSGIVTVVRGGLVTEPPPPRLVAVGSDAIGVRAAAGSGALVASTFVARGALVGAPPVAVVVAGPTTTGTSRPSEAGTSTTWSGPTVARSGMRPGVRGPVEGADRVSAVTAVDVIGPPAAHHVPTTTALATAASPAVVAAR
jgi:hypothetical protein